MELEAVVVEESEQEVEQEVQAAASIAAAHGYCHLFMNFIAHIRKQCKILSPYNSIASLNTNTQIEWFTSQYYSIMQRWSLLLRHYIVRIIERKSLRWADFDILKAFCQNRKYYLFYYPKIFWVINGCLIGMHWFWNKMNMADLQENLLLYLGLTCVVIDTCNHGK